MMTRRNSSLAVGTGIGRQQMVSDVYQKPYRKTWLNEAETRLSYRGFRFLESSSVEATTLHRLMINITTPMPFFLGSGKPSFSGSDENSRVSCGFVQISLLLPSEKQQSTVLICS